MTELNIEQERRELFSAWEKQRRQNAQAILPCDAFLAGIEAAKRAAQGSAEPVYFIRPHNFAWTNPEHNPTWCEASEDAYHHTLSEHRRICYTAPPAPVSAEPVADNDWRLVPVQCTEAMRQALIESCDVWGCSAASRVWADMLAAAQIGSEPMKFDKNSHVIEVLIQIGSVRASGGIPFLQFKKMTRAERTAAVADVMNDAMECYYDTGSGQ